MIADLLWAATRAVERIHWGVYRLYAWAAVRRTHREFYDWGGPAWTGR